MDGSSVDLSNDHALQVKLEEASSANGLQLDLIYTFSKSIDINSRPRGGFRSMVIQTSADLVGTRLRNAFPQN